MPRLSRSSWILGAAAAGSGLCVAAGVAALLNRILPTLPKVSLAGIPGLAAGLAAAYGVWWVARLALQSASWGSFREALLEALSPFDPADHGGQPRQQPQPSPEQALMQLQSQVAALRAELERQGLQLQQSEAERLQLQQQQQKLEGLLQRTEWENQKLRSQQEEWARQLEQCQQEVQTLRESCHALATLCEISFTLIPKPSAGVAAASHLCPPAAAQTHSPRCPDLSVSLHPNR